MGGKTFRVVLALLIGILGAVTLGALAGARRTDTAYDRYLTRINASNAFVNVPGVLPGMPVTRPISLISALPGVISHATYIGLNGYPVVDGSLDGEYFTQDRASVLAGALPPPESTTTVVLTPGTARMFGVGVGGTVRYQFSRRGPQGQPAGKPFTRSFRVAAIAEIPPALADGTAGIPRLQQQLSALASRLERQINGETGQKGDDLSFTINRTDVVEGQVRQAITPEVIALSVFGAIAGLAMLVLAGQGLAQSCCSRWASGWPRRRCCRWP